jgi:hypothetical protein
MRNVVDLARFLLPTPPVPTRWRRRMIALGSGEPTRAICSTLIAAAFQHVRYPILPKVERIVAEKRGMTEFQRQEILHIRHHSLYTPADFDLSPYFRVVKPTIEEKFDYRQLTWAHATIGGRVRDPIMRRRENPKDVVVTEQVQRAPRRRPVSRPLEPIRHGH